MFIPIVKMPYEDELLISYIYRLAEMNAISFENFCDNYLIKRKRILKDIIIDFPRFCSALNIPYDKITSLFMHTSIFPFESLAMDELRQELYLSSYFRGGKPVFNELLDDIRICKKCVEEDIKKYNRFYLHRSHNLNRVNVCYKHGCYLSCCSNIKSTLDLNEFKEIKSNSTNILVEQEYAIFCKSLLDLDLDISVNDIHNIVYEKYGNQGIRNNDVIKSKYGLLLSKNIKSIKFEFSVINKIVVGLMYIYNGDFNLLKNDLNLIVQGKKYRSINKYKNINNENFVLKKYHCQRCNRMFYSTYFGMINLGCTCTQKQVYDLLKDDYDVERNSGIELKYANYSTDKLWWKCKKGHSWKATMFERNSGRGCPYCSNHRALAGYNDIVTVDKNLAGEWNYDKNDGLKPEQFTVGSNEKIWWKCKKGHEWVSSIVIRTKGSGCPFCTNQKVLVGYNDMITVDKSLAGEWNYEKNGDLKPEQFTVGSNKKVWWKCKKGHEWVSRIAIRREGTGCPFCTGKQVLIGYNDLSTVNRKLADEWDYEKNGDLKPEQFTVGSSKKVWWKCKNGHSWLTNILARTKGTGCPYCLNKKVLIGYNDLSTVNSKLADEWDYEKNGDLKPEQFTVGSDKKVWWKCENGHEWSSTIRGRNMGKGCPHCFRLKRYLKS